MGVITRGNKLYLRFQDATRVWRTERTGLEDTPAGRQQAAELLAEVIREAAHARGDAPAPSLLPVETVRAYAEPWLERRKREDLDWHADHSRLKHHVLPAIGDLPIASVRAKHIVDMFAAIKAKGLAQRTVYNVYSLVSALFRDAKADEKIEQSPCCLTERQLGPRKDKDPEWRAGAVFTRVEAIELISSSRIPHDRRVVYALELLAGIRCGEAAGLRWRHLTQAKPLGCLLVAYSFNSKKNRTKETKTESVRYVPVHATLAAILAEWRLGGWEAMHGRAPTPDDLIVPLPPADAARRLKRQGEPYRSTDYSGRKWRDEDLPALEWRHRRHYDMRATFITLAIEDGADPTVLRDFVTHTKQSRDAFDGYVRSKQWPRVCGEVAKLQISRHSAVTAQITMQHGDGSSWGPWESHATNPTRGDTLCTETPTLTIVRGVHSDAPDVESCDDSLQPDSVIDALDDAREQWRTDHDPRALRRALLRLLGDLD